MVKFKHKEDGSVFIAEPNTIQYRVLKANDKYEIVKEEKKKKDNKKKAAK